MPGVSWSRHVEPEAIRLVDRLSTAHSLDYDRGAGGGVVDHASDSAPTATANEVVRENTIFEWLDALLNESHDGSCCQNNPISFGFPDTLGLKL